MSGAISFTESERAKRRRLSECVPLDKPYTIRISPSSVCNLRCEFCGQSVPENRVRFSQSGNHGLMDMQVYQRLIDNIADSFGRVIKIVFVGRGEPILHPQIADFVAYAVKKQAAEQVEILTNGVTLSSETSDRLIDSGLTSLRISVNGLNSEDYLKYCNTKIDFDAYVQQIRYFYEHKRDTSLYVKIINYMVNTPERLEEFRRIFDPVCDVINVENLYKTNADIDFDKLTDEPEKLLYTQNTGKCVQTETCSSPFYVLQIDEDGFVQPCCGPIFPTEGHCLGNAGEMSLRDLWFKKSYPFQRRLLDGIKGLSFCEGCSVRLSQTYPEDVLDGDAERLKALYDERLQQGGNQRNL